MADRLGPVRRLPFLSAAICGSTRRTESLSDRTVMDASRIQDLKASPAIQLAGYYIVLLAIVGLLATSMPWFQDLLLPGLGSGASIGDFESALESGSPMPLDTPLGETLATVFIVLLGALAFNAPVVWIYMVIMRQEGYEQAFVRMLTALPVVVAGVVQVVRGDLALAFALAGIVAAVRFRTTVKDLQNAVFAFAAIGIGLAAGTGSMVLAGSLAITVSFLAYTMWRLDVGDVAPSLELGHSGVQLSEALVPGESHRAVVIGHEESVEPVHAEDLEPLSDAIDRLADYVSADALRKKKKYNTLMLVHTDDIEAAEKKLAGVLEEHASRWVHVDTIARNGSGIQALEYLLRLKKDIEVGKMVDRLGCGEDSVLKAVELKPIKGLRDRLT